jgi:penicillin amidase
MIRPMKPRLLPFLALLGCLPPIPEGPSPQQQAIEGVPETATFQVAGLQCDAQVVRTAGNVPHIYARDRVDLARAYGFVQARDRYFEMELARRLGRGTVSELLGQDALESDMDSRAIGMTWAAQNFLTHMSAEHEAIFDGFAEGVNAYIEAVRVGSLPPPSELEIAGPFLGSENPVDLMKPWERADVAAVAAVLLYQLGFETADVGKTAARDAVAAGPFDGTDPNDDLRNSGIGPDLFERLEPVWPYVSAPSAATGNSSAARRADAPDPVSTRARAERQLTRRLASRLERLEKRLGREGSDVGWGSNVWAVSGNASATGASLLAGDGHLPLSVPSLFWQVGLDTRVFGGGEIHQLGLGIPGMPLLAVGTNGRVAWSQTQLMGDITDWYAEELLLDTAGSPSASRFQGEWRPLQVFTEAHTVADVPLLGSEGRTFSWKRYTTFDGRWIADIEGTPVDLGTAGSIDFPGGAVLPADVDGDGKVSAISFDYTAFSDGNILNAVDRFGKAASVEEFADATRYLVAYSQNMGVIDHTGKSMYTGYQAVPCRTHLPRDPSGSWLEGADPRYLIDGTQYGGFEIPVLADGQVDESQASDPSRCVVPFDEYPMTIEPAAGYVVNANNDPAGFSLDSDLTNDRWYIGGPWDNGWRAQRIAERIEEQIVAGTADVEGMAAIQADHQSALGLLFGPHLVAAITNARAAHASGTAEGASARIATLYAADSAAFDAVASRMQGWIDRGAFAASGVTTFYEQPTPTDVEDSIATMLFNAWLSRWDDRVLGDEALPDVWQGGGSTGRVRALARLLRNRGDTPPESLASWDPATRESVYFDVRGTEAHETSDEVTLLALGDALAFLRSAPDEDLRGSGFGNSDMTTWKWGLRHWTRFESVLADFVDASSFSFLTDQFAISTEVLPLEGGTDVAGIEWFPRPGDNFSVDAANSGWGDDFTHGYGPVFRMVIALGPDGSVSGQNVIPGGQSALIESEYFADQTALWLANETLPMHFAPGEVVANALGRERLAGSNCNE